jgi:hypothetical protein
VGISGTSLKLTQIGANTSIVFQTGFANNFGSQTLLVLKGTQASSLTSGNSIQFVST